MLYFVVLLQVLRYWCDNTKKKMNKGKPHKTTLPEEEAKELAALEKRLYEFLKKEEAKEIVVSTNILLRFHTMRFI